MPSPVEVGQMMAAIFVRVNKFFDDSSGFGRVGFGVADDHLDERAIDGDFLVNLVHHHLLHQLGGGADRGRWPRREQKEPTV